MIEPTKILLIGGSGRSGTTILKTIFSQHPAIAFAPEARFTVDPDGILDFYCSLSQQWSPFLFDVHLRRLERLLKNVGRRQSSYKLLRSLLRRFGLHPHSRWQLVPQYTGVDLVDYCPNYYSLVDTLINQLVEFRYDGAWAGATLFQSTDMSFAPSSPQSALAKPLGNFIGQVGQDIANAQQAQYVLDDNTWNILWFDKYIELVPDAKMVHIYRDPRDVIASYTKQTWMPSDAIKSASIYKEIMDQWALIRQRLPHGAYLEVSLESLVSEPRDVLQRLCSFWGLEWNDALLNVDLSHSNSGRWQRDLSPPVSDDVQAIVKELLIEYGYTS